MNGFNTPAGGIPPALIPDPSADPLNPILPPWTEGLLFEGEIVRMDDFSRIRLRVLGRMLSAVLARQNGAAVREGGPLPEAGKAAVFQVMQGDPELVVSVRSEVSESGEEGAPPSAGKEISGKPTPGASPPPRFPPGLLEPGDRILARVLSLRPSPDFSGAGPVRESPVRGYRAVLSLGRSSMSAEVSSVVPQGRPTVFQVVRTQPLLVLDPVSVPSAGEKAVSSLPVLSLDKGSRIFGRVIRWESPAGGENISPAVGRAEIEVGGERIPVLLARPVAGDEARLFRVLEGGTPPLLAPVEDRETSPAPALPGEAGFPGGETSTGPLYDTLIRTLRELLPLLDTHDAQEMRVRAVEVLHVLQSMVYTGESQEGSGFLENVLSALGWMHGPEAEHSGEGAPRPPALPALLLGLDRDLAEWSARSSPASDHPERAKIVSRLRRSLLPLARHILDATTANVESLSRHRSFALSVPFAWDGVSGTGRLWIRLPPAGERERKEGQEPSKETLVVFLLDLERLGPLRVDARLYPDDRISVTLLTERREVSAFVRRCLPLLEERLTRRDLRVIHLECLQVDRRRIREDPFSRMDGGGEEEGVHIVV